MKNMRVAGRLSALLFLLATIGCDRATKHFAATNLAETQPRSYFADTVRLEYVENRGAFLGLGSGLPEWVRIGLFRVGVALSLAAITFVALRHRWTGVSLVGASLIVAGGASNLADRIAHGSVVDFMSIGVGLLRTGIFNVADVAIMIGGAMIVFGKRPTTTSDSGTAC